MSKRLAGPASAQPFTRDLVDAQAFWRRVDKSGDCWLWTGPRSRTGYGAMTILKFRDGPVHTHRISYVLQHGSIPAGMCVLHSCDNPPCVNPAHLRIGTHAENIADAIAKGRAKFQKARDCQWCGVLLPTGGHCAPCRIVRAAQVSARMNEELSARNRERSGIVAQDYIETHIAPLLPDSFGALARRTDARRAQVLARAFGLFGFAPETLEAIGQDLGITRERARQLRNDTLRKIGATAETIAAHPHTTAWKKGVAA